MKNKIREGVVSRQDRNYMTCFPRWRTGKRTDYTNMHEAELGHIIRTSGEGTTEEEQSLDNKKLEGEERQEEAETPEDKNLDPTHLEWDLTARRRKAIPGQLMVPHREHEWKTRLGGGERETGKHPGLMLKRQNRGLERCRCFAEKF